MPDYIDVTEVGLMLEHVETLEDVRNWEPVSHMFEVRPSHGVAFNKPVLATTLGIMAVHVAKTKRTKVKCSAKMRQKTKHSEIKCPVTEN